MNYSGLIFVIQESGSDVNSNDCMVGLLSLEVVNIRPNYEAMVRAGHLKPADVSGTGKLKRFKSLKQILMNLQTR